MPLESEGKSTDIAAKSVGWSGDRASVATFQPRQMFAYLDRRQIHRHSRQVSRLVGRHGKNQHTKEDVQTFAAPDSGNSRDIAAKSVGWLGGTGAIEQEANICRLKAGEKTRDIAAKSVGWSGVAESIP